MEKFVSIIDTHCHIDMPLFSADVEGIMHRSRESGVSDFIVPGYIASGWSGLLTLCNKFEFMHAAPGLHPMYLEHHEDEHIDQLELICQQEPIIAIGEIGLDFFRDKSTEKAQRKLFERQLHLAKKYSLPVLIHVRKAHDQVASILRKTGFDNGGIIHAFNGSSQQAEKYLNLGFKLGYGGTLTYSRAKKIRSLAAALPLTAIVLETDAPDIPLSHRRDKANSPEFLTEILDALTALRSETKAEIALQTSRNVRSVLSLPAR